MDFISSSEIKYDSSEYLIVKELHQSFETIINLKTIIITILMFLILILKKMY